MYDQLVLLFGIILEKIWSKHENADGETIQIYSSHIKKCQIK